MKKFEIDPFEVTTAYVQSIWCECGWEITAVMPEDRDYPMMTMLRHIQDKHAGQNPLPLFTCHVY